MYQETDDAIDILSRFVRDSLDASAKDVPALVDVRAAISTLIARNYFNQADYEIQNLLRVSESKKAISYVELNSHLENLVPHARQMRDLEKHRAIHGWTENEDPFSDI
jgi:hypothetical protein